jgi:hypothetical protein
LYTQVQVSEVLHSARGNRGASLDKNRAVRHACTASQLSPLGLIATACQWLDARVDEVWSVEDLDLLMLLVFPATGTLLMGIRVMQYGADTQAIGRSSCQSIE